MAASRDLLKTIKQPCSAILSQIILCICVYEGGPSPPPLQLRRKRHPARPAARAAQGDEDALLLLVVEVGAVEHGGGLALEEFVERQVAGDDAVVGGERGGVLGRRGGGFSRRFFSF